MSFVSFFFGLLIFEVGVRRVSKQLKWSLMLVPFNRSHTISISIPLLTMSVSSAIFKIFNLDMVCHLQA